MKPMPSATILQQINNSWHADISNKLLHDLWKCSCENHAQSKFLNNQFNSCHANILKAENSNELAWVKNLHGISWLWDFMKTMPSVTILQQVNNP